MSEGESKKRVSQLPFVGVGQVTNLIICCANCQSSAPSGLGRDRQKCSQEWICDLPPEVDTLNLLQGGDLIDNLTRLDQDVAISVRFLWVDQFIGLVIIGHRL